jgi:hypothetical protein
VILALTKADQNKAMLDPWSLVHFACGLAAGLVNAPKGPALVAAIAYEFAEQKIEGYSSFFGVSGPEGMPNAIADVALFAIGQELGARWNASE